MFDKPPPLNSASVWTRKCAKSFDHILFVSFFSKIYLILLSEIFLLILTKIENQLQLYGTYGTYKTSTIEDFETSDSLYQKA